MTSLKSIVVGGLVAVALTGTALVPAVFAQSATTAEVTGGGQNGMQANGSRFGGPGMVPGGPGGGAGLAGLNCDTGAAGRLETMLGQMSSQLGLSADQSALFDAYRTAALAAQTSFADACAAALPQATASAPDLLTVTKGREAIAKAQVAALDATLPSLEAFYGSLSDQQKSQLMPQARFGQNPGGNGQFNGPMNQRGDHHGFGGKGQQFGENGRGNHHDDDDDGFRGNGMQFPFPGHPPRPAMPQAPGQPPAPVPSDG